MEDESENLNTSGTEASEMEVNEVSGANGDQREKFTKKPFDPEEWELVEEDECVIDLMGMVNKEYLKKCNKDRVKLIGLFDEKGEVFLQLDQLIFTGEPAEGFGTNVLFQTVPADGSSDDEETLKTTNYVPVEKVNLKYVTNTRKKISMSRAFLTKKVE